jgi:hypothetical protein
MVSLDGPLVGLAGLFVFVSLVFEPLGLAICGWDGLVECKETSYVGAAWHLYASRFDPIFLELPLWLKIMNSLDTLLFSWVYLAVAIMLPRGVFDRSPALRACGCAWAGALCYSTIVYFSYEIIAEAGRADLPMVALINLPWSVWPVLLLVRLSADTGARAKRA